MSEIKPEWEGEFDNEFTENGNGWSAPNIYRDGGRTIIKNLKDFIAAQIKKAKLEVFEMLEIYFAHIQNDGSGKSMNLTQEEIAKDILSSLKSKYTV